MTPFTDGVTVKRRRKVDSGQLDRGRNPIFTDEVSTLPQTAAFDPGGSVEPVEVGRTPVITKPTLYFLERPDLIEFDEVEVLGSWYTVEGAPAAWSDPWGSGVGGTVVQLRRVDG